jgi:hypothetical protein
MMADVHSVTVGGYVCDRLPIRDGGDRQTHFQWLHDHVSSRRRDCNTYHVKVSADGGWLCPVGQHLLK